MPLSHDRFDSPRDPVWISIRCSAHRPLPDGLIAQASLIRQPMDLTWRYKVVLTIELANAAMLRTCGDAVAVDPGWRRVPEGVGVGYHESNPRKSGIAFSRNVLG